MEEEEGLNRAIMMSFSDSNGTGTGTAGEGSATTTGTGTTTSNPTEANIELLVSMGFNRQVATEALRDAGNDVEVATDRLLSSS